MKASVKHVVFILTAAILTGCGNYPRTPPQLEAELTRQYIDKPANEFFETYGQPAGDFVKDDGSTVYRWVSVPFPAHPVFTRYRAASGYYDIIDTYNGQPQAYYCELRIYADPDNVIRRFTVAVDTMGKWSSSRCTELLV